MIEIPITPDMLKLAQAKAQELGHLRNSIKRGKGNIDGFVGEVAANALFQGDWSNTYDFDLTYKGYTIDVKTKLTTVKPRDDYEASVADFNTTQQCDFYVFCRVLKGHSVAWLCGIVPKCDFYANARFMTKGQVDGSNNFVVKADCYNMVHYDMPLPVAVVNRASKLGFNIVP